MSVARGAALTGDVDQNGQVDIRDVVILTRHLEQGLSLSEGQRVCADVDGDYLITRQDRAFLIGFILGEWDSETRPKSTAVDPPREAPEGAIIEIGPNHRVMRVDFEPWEADVPAEERAVLPEHQVYTQIESGLNYWDDENATWRAAVAEFEETDASFAATQTRTQVVAPRSLGSGSPVEFELPGGEEIFWLDHELRYFDSESGEAHTVASNRDAAGERIGSNTVVYKNAFEGLRADIIYTLEKSGVTQEVRLYERPPEPETFEIAPERARLQWVSHVRSAASPEFEREVLIKEENESLRELLASPDFVDTNLGFDQAEFPETYAKTWSPEGLSESNWARVSKNWELDLSATDPEAQEIGAIDTGAWLVSTSLAYEEVAMRLAQLPEAGAASAPFDKGLQFGIETRTGAIGNQRFQAGRTYLLTGTCFADEVVVEGGAVLKYGPGATLVVLKDIEAKGRAYQPAFLTSMHDDSVGARIAGSSGSPAAGDFGAAIDLFCRRAAFDFRRLTIRYGSVAIARRSNREASLDLWFTQILDVNTPFSSVSDLNIRAFNVLAANFDQLVRARRDSVGIVFEGQHLTIDSGESLGTGPVSITLKNSLISDVDDLTPTPILTSSHVGTGAELYEKRGGGSYYLKGSSLVRDAGSSEIDEGLKEALPRMTTFPPEVLENGTFDRGSLRPDTSRDPGALDLGYHYDVLDYAISNMSVANGFDLSTSAGTVIGVWGRYGMRPEGSGQMSFAGTMDERIVVTGFENVQEGTHWSDPRPSSYRFMIRSGAMTDGRRIEALFTDWRAAPAGDRGSTQFLVWLDENLGNWLFGQSRFFNGTFRFDLPSSRTGGIFDSIFSGVNFIGMDRGGPFVLRNSTVAGTMVHWRQAETGVEWIVKDNIFHRFQDVDSEYRQLDSLHNIFVDGPGGELADGTSIQTLAALDPDFFVTGVRGDHYVNEKYRSFVQNKGSQRAWFAGLARRSVFVGDSMEVEDPVDIVDLGAHYGPEPRESQGLNLAPSHWLFDAGFDSEEGVQPMEAPEGVQMVDSFDGSAVEFANVPVSGIKYPDRDASATYLDLRESSVSFWYRPNWSTAENPPDRVALLAVGESSDIGSRVLVIESGNTVKLQERATSGSYVEPILVEHEFNEGTWYEFTLVTFNDGISALYINGESFSARWSTTFVSSRTVGDGFVIGADYNGAHSCRGVIDELVLLPYRMSPIRVEFRHDNSVMGEAKVVGNSDVELRWRNSFHTPATIRKRVATNFMDLEGSEFGDPIGATSDWRFRESDAVPKGSIAEYKIDKATQKHLFISNDIFQFVANDAPPRHERGGLALLVDEELLPSIESEVEELVAELTSDGWKVFVMPSPRNRDDMYVPSERDVNRVNVEAIRAEIIARREELKMIYILGHVAVPYSGFYTFDGHGPRASVADSYYADIDDDGEIPDWGDSINRLGSVEAIPELADCPEARWDGNLSNDGKLDQSALPSDLELALGRVDFSNLPSFTLPGESDREAEVRLLLQYLEKASEWRRGATQVPVRGAGRGTFLFRQDFELNHTLEAAISSVVGIDDTSVRTLEPFLEDQEPWLFGFSSGTGDYDARTLANGPDPTKRRAYSARKIAESRLTPKIYFWMMSGSYFGDWNYRRYRVEATGEPICDSRSADNLLRSVLATESGGLGSMFGLFINWRLGPMAIGETIGEAVRYSINNPEKESYEEPLFSLLGDPTLRLQTPPAPTGLSAMRGENVQLSWDESDDAGSGYYIYLSTDGALGPYTLLNPEDPEPSTTFVDESAPVGDLNYLVKAVERTVNASGSYFNLSVGVRTLVPAFE